MRDPFTKKLILIQLYKKGDRQKKKKKREKIDVSFFG